jgi:lysophospholipase L1-like esterase
MTDRRSLIKAVAVAGLLAAGARAEPGRSDAQMVTDWPWLGRYAADNQRLKQEKATVEIVFIGDSITELWPQVRKDYFRKEWVCRGIGGQTSPQILLRMMADVVALRPRLVHILAGTNDVAGNTGPISPEATVANLVAMGQLAKANGIRPVIGTIPPAASFFWKPDINPPERIMETNRLLKRAARAERIELVDYFAAMADANGALPASHGEDGVHPNAQGYAVMESVLAARFAGFRCPECR